MINEQLPEGQRTGLEEQLRSLSPIISAAMEKKAVINLNIYAGDIGQKIDQAEHVMMGLDEKLQMYFKKLLGIEKDNKTLPPEPPKIPDPPKIKEKKATKEMMSRAAKLTLDGGYWKSQRSWTVIYEIYCIWGYRGSINDFLVEANNWPDGVAGRMTCNRDAVEKLRNKYNFSKEVKEWRSKGIPEPYCILGEHLETELQRMAESEGA